MSRDCCVALPHDVMGSLQFVMVAFPDHTHYFWCARAAHAQTENCLYTGENFKQSVKGNWGPWKLCLFQYTNSNTLHVFTIIYFMSA